MKLKQEIKYVVFLLQSTYIPLTFPQNRVFKNPLLPKTLPLWAVPSHITMVQKQQEFKIQTNNVP
jgi:hypothetical protein